MLANATSQNNHSCFLGFSRELIKVPDVLNDVHNEAGIAEGVEVYHISEGSVCERRTEDRDIVLCEADSARVLRKDTRNKYLFTLYAQ